MSGLTSLKMVFVGHFDKFSGLLGVPPNRFEVHEGATTLVGPEPAVKALAAHLRVMYQAFPDGSPELAEMQAAIRLARGEVTVAPVITVDSTANPEDVKEQLDGSGALQAGGSDSDGAAQVQGNGGPAGPGAAEGGADSGGGAADAPAGAAERGADGDGPKHLVNGEPAGTPQNAKLVRALSRLDPKNDEHWTRDGKPSVAAVERLYGSADVRRSDIDAAAPGLMRLNAPQPLPANV